MSKLEHVNIAVTNPTRTANILCDLFDWQIHWSGSGKPGGQTVRVSSGDEYVAVYTHDGQPDGDGSTGSYKGGFNHVGIEFEVVSYY